MRQLDAEPPRGAENRLAGANVDLAIVDGKGRGYGLAAAIGRADNGALVRDIHAALVLNSAAGGAFRLMAVTGWLLLLTIVHRATWNYQCPSGLVSSSGKYINTYNKGFGAA
jgi:hypothetical protein